MRSVAATGALVVLCACGGGSGEGPVAPSGNQDPVARVGADRTMIQTGDDFRTVVQLDASGSTDPDGDLLGYVWSAGRGRFVEGTGATDAAVRLTFPGDESQVVEVEVSDGRGGSDRAAVEIRLIPTPPPREQCGPFPQWTTSPHRLPYPVGESYLVIQANCSGFGHSGFWKHGYDFRMDIGTPVTAIRAGTVGWANDGCRDGDGSCTNLVTVIHDDGTVALYSHLTLGGVAVRSGQRVDGGDLIGHSGNTGFTGGIPHLHLSLHSCNQLPGLPGAGDCPTLPLTFHNTDPNPTGLFVQREWPAY